MKKLENLLSFNDFNSNWKGEQPKHTKRTETGLDIIKENIEDVIEEIIPEGLPDDDVEMSFDKKIEKIENFVDSTHMNDVIEDIVSELRGALLKMEQEGSIDTRFSDDLDDEHQGDWHSWIKDVIILPDLPEESLNNIIKDINNFESEEDEEFNSDDEFGQIS